MYYIKSRYDLYKTNIYAPVKMKNGNMEVTRYLHKWDLGKKIKISQKGSTPIFTQ